MEDNFHLSNKKALFLNMRQYYDIQGLDVFQVLPVTFHIKNGDQDPEFAKFSEYYQAEEEKRTGKMNTANVWIIKPGENTNRGQGIQVERDFEVIRRILNESVGEQTKRTCIVQKYLQTPLLVHRRKFDIRVFSLMTSVNGALKGFFYQDGYLRTSW